MIFIRQPEEGEDKSCKLEPTIQENSRCVTWLTILPEVARVKAKKEVAGKIPELIERQSSAICSEAGTALAGLENLKDLEVLDSTSNANALRRFSGCKGSSGLLVKRRLEDRRVTSGNSRKYVLGPVDRRASAICCSSSDALPSSSDAESCMSVTSPRAATCFEDSAAASWSELVSSEGRAQK